MAKIDYDRLLRDRRLDIAISIGYEFDNEITAMEALLRSNGFMKKANPATDNEYDTYYLRKKFILSPGKPGQDIDIYVYLSSSKKKDPAKVFASFLATKEIVIYSGHARVGIGPDFDDEHTATQNFIIGMNSALHTNKVLTTQQSPHDLLLLKKYAAVAAQRKDNDLETISKKNLFREDLYQVWFFNACTSIDYLDEIRGKWSVKDKKKVGLVTVANGKIKSKDNLVVFGTRKSVQTDAIPIVKRLIEGKTMEDIIKAMNEYERSLSGHKTASSVFFSD